MGNTVLFNSAEALSSVDQDAGASDIYRSSGGTVSLVSSNETVADVQFDAASADGSLVFGTTAQCHDGGVCLWRFQAAGGSQVNQTTTAHVADFKAAAPDGNRVLFETSHPWIEDDGGKVDILLDQFPNGAANNQTEQFLRSPNTAAQDVKFEGASTDLEEVVFSTTEAIPLTGDGNGTGDLYGFGGPWDNAGNDTLLSNGTGAADDFDAIAAHGSAILYTTPDNSAGPPNNDADGLDDIYWSMGLGGLLVSGGSTAPVTYVGATPDLGRVYYTTTERIDPANDTDTTLDVYARDTVEGAVDTLVTPGTADQDVHFDDVAADKSVVFDTKESLGGSGDSDIGRDVYRIVDGGAPVLLSGNGDADATFDARAGNGAVFFTTSDQLTTADTDNAPDVYVNEGGTVTLVSGGTANVPATFAGANADGSMVAFTTTEQLTSADTDGALDIYTFGAVSTPPPPPDTTPPTGRASAKTQKNDGTIEVTLTCSEACIATPSGTLTVPVVTARGKKKFTLKGATVTVGAGAKATLRLKVPKKAKKAATAALKAGKKVTAKVSVVITDAAGNKRTVSTTLKLRK